MISKIIKYFYLPFGDASPQMASIIPSKHAHLSKFTNFLNIIISGGRITT